MSCERSRALDPRIWFHGRWARCLLEFARKERSWPWESRWRPMDLLGPTYQKPTGKLGLRPGARTRWSVVAPRLLLNLPHFAASAQGVIMKRVVVASVLALAGSYVASARAQEAGHGGYFEKTMPSPTQSFELAVSTAYNQGWGNITDTNSIAARTFGRQIQ